jgi:outer membrane lipoprotein-sorting protein
MNYLRLIVIFLISVNVFAQDAKKAKQLLDEVSAKVKTYENINIDFKYTISNPKENIFQESKGNVVLKTDLYLLNFMGIVKIFDGKLTYTIVPEDEEVTISKLDEEDENAITPSKMLTFFQTGFTYKWDIPQEIKGRKIQ